MQQVARKVADLDRTFHDARAHSDWHVFSEVDRDGNPIHGPWCQGIHVFRRGGWQLMSEEPSLDQKATGPKDHVHIFHGDVDRQNVDAQGIGRALAHWMGFISNVFLRYPVKGTPDVRKLWSKGANWGSDLNSLETRHGADRHGDWASIIVDGYLDNREVDNYPRPVKIKDDYVFPNWWDAKDFVDCHRVGRHVVDNEFVRTRFDAINSDQKY